jgi:hypothetical protein
VSTKISTHFEVRTSWIAIPEGVAQKIVVKTGSDRWPEEAFMPTEFSQVVTIIEGFLVHRIAVNGPVFTSTGKLHARNRARISFGNVGYNIKVDDQYLDYAWREPPEWLKPFLMDPKVLFETGSNLIAGVKSIWTAPK